MYKLKTCSSATLELIDQHLFAIYDCICIVALWGECEAIVAVVYIIKVAQHWSRSIKPRSPFCGRYMEQLVITQFYSLKWINTCTCAPKRPTAVLRRGRCWPGTSV